MSDTTTDTTWVLTETDLLDKLDELGFNHLTLAHSDKEHHGTDLEWHCLALREHDGAPIDPAIYSDGMNGRVSTTTSGEWLHVGHYGPTRLAALTALVALAEQQADR